MQRCTWNREQQQSTVCVTINYTAVRLRLCCVSKYIYNTIDKSLTVKRITRTANSGQESVIACKGYLVNIDTKVT